MSVRGGQTTASDKLVLYLDATNKKSYPGSGTTWSNLLSLSNKSYLYNGPVFNASNFGCISFDGVNDYGEISSISATNKISSQFTAEIVMRIPPSYNNGVVSIITNRPNNDYLATFGVLFDDRAVERPWNPTSKSDNRALVVWAGNGGGGTPFLYRSDCFKGEWAQVTLVCDSSYVYFYYNGELAQSAVFGGSIQKPNYNLRLCQYGFSVDYPFVGYLQSIKIYNKSLTSKEVLRNYNSIKNRFNVPSIVTAGLVLNFVPSNTDSYPGPGSGDTLYDLTGNRYNGTLTNGASFDSSNGGNITFDGVDDSVNFDTLPSYGGTDAHTYEMWIKATDVSATYTWLIQNGGGAYQTTGTSLILYSGKIGFFYYGGAAVVQGSSGLSANTWYHICVSYSGDTVVKIYLNGQLDATKYTTQPTAGTPVSNWSSGNVYPKLGVYNYNNFYPYNGKMSDVRIYNRGLSAKEVLQNFNATKGKFGL